MTTPFDDPQAELAWMFLQNLSADGDLDEGFDLLSDDFTYWSNAARRTCDKAELRRITERIKNMVTINFEMISCLNEGENVVIEAQPDGVTNAGVRYETPIAFIFETRDGLITSLREYGDTRLVAEAYRHDTATSDRYFAHVMTTGRPEPMPVPVVLVYARDDVTTSGGNHRPPGCERSPEPETLSDDTADGFPHRADSGTEGVRQHGQNDQRGCKARVSTWTSGDAVDCLLERGCRDQRVARGIGTRSGLAYLRARRSENAADTTGDRAEDDERQQGRALPRDAERLPDSSDEETEQDYQVAGEKPLGADLLFATVGCGLCG